MIRTIIKLLFDAKSNTELQISDVIRL